jgi:hypothetical protein
MVRKAYWKHQVMICLMVRGTKGRYYPAIKKKRSRKKPMYKQEDIKIQYLEPLDNGTIVNKEMTEESIFVNFITGPEVGLWMPHEVTKEVAYGQLYVENHMKLIINWTHHMWSVMATKPTRSSRGITGSLDAFQHIHYPMYLSFKETFVEEVFKTGVKSPDLETMKQRRELKINTVVLLWPHHRNWQGITRKDGYLVLEL